jgi:hypothetical protein
MNVIQHLQDSEKIPSAQANFINLRHTNTTSEKDLIYFSFTNDVDLDKISKVSLADNDTVRSIVKTLPHRCCLAIGKVVCDLPIVLEIAALGMLALGETKKFFKT